MTVLDDLRHPDPEQRRQAIIAVARQGNQDALPALDQITRLDPDSSLRELARKAIRHLHKNQSGADPLGFDEAHRQFVLALQTYKKKGAVAAAPVLAKALRLDPTLQEDELTMRIAAEATGLPAAEAVRALIYADQYGQMLRPDRGGWRPQARRQPYKWLMILLFAGVTVFLFLRTGVFNSYIGSLQTQQWREHLRRDTGTAYYLFVPEGSPPPEGWGILVALHDFSYGADTLLPFFVEAAAEAGVILIVPNFGEYPFPFTELTTPAIDAIVQQVRREYRTHPTGAVIFGYRLGGEIATMYAKDYYQVAGVVTLGATELVLPPEDDEFIEYLLMFGEYDTNRSLLSERLVEFEFLLNPTQIFLASNVDSALTPDYVSRTMQFVRRIYNLR